MAFRGTCPVSVPLRDLLSYLTCAELEATFPSLRAMYRLLTHLVGRYRHHFWASDLRIAGLDDVNHLNRDRTQSFLQHASATLVVASIGRVISTEDVQTMLKRALQRTRPGGRVALVCTMSEVVRLHVMQSSRSNFDAFAGCTTGDAPGAHARSNQRIGILAFNGGIIVQRSFPNWAICT